MKILSLYDGMACGVQMLGNGWTVEVIAHLIRAVMEGETNGA